MILRMWGGVGGEEAGGGCREDRRVGRAGGNLEQDMGGCKNMCEAVGWVGEYQGLLWG